MPNIKSAKKKLRKDAKRTQKNEAYRKSIRRMVKSLSQKGGKSKMSVEKAYSAIDRAAKKKVIHKNKAARLKSRVSKLLSKK